MESINELRELTKEWRRKSVTPGRNPAADKVDCIVDAIEAEVAEKYMELPLDADGVPIRIGDVVTWLNGTPSSKFTIDTFAFDMEHGEWDVKDSNFLNTLPAHRCRHVKPRTLEDILQSAGVSVAAVEDVAAEIKELLGAVD